MAVPTVVADTATTVQGNPVTVTVLANDTYVGEPVVTFHATQPTGVTRVSATRCTHETQGEWNIVSSTVVYSPSATHTGAAAAISVTVTDSGGAASATCTVTVTAASNYATDRIDDAAVIALMGRRGRHSGSGRSVDVTLTSELTAGEGIDLSKLGLSSLDQIQVLIPNSGTPRSPKAGVTIASGRTVRFVGR